MLAIDASSVIYAWDNYPISQFPTCWTWLGALIAHNQIVIPSIAFTEVGNKAPDCAVWLTENNIERLEVNNAVLQRALSIKSLLGITDDDYHPKGVGENDILIIATAKEHGLKLMSDEEKQNNLPQNLKKYKIPAVCGLQGVSVECIDFLTFLKNSGTVF